MVIIENAIGPHEHAPADAPIIVPIILEPIFLVSFVESYEYTWNSKWLVDCWVDSVHTRNDDAWAFFDVF